MPVTVYHTSRIALLCGCFLINTIAQRRTAMSAILPKSQMSEEDIKLQYITPAITAKWDRTKITMETQITDGKVKLNGNF